MSTSDNFNEPLNCEKCSSPLMFKDIHLSCRNRNCVLLEVFKSYLYDRNREIKGAGDAIFKIIIDITDCNRNQIGETLAKYSRKRIEEDFKENLKEVSGLGTSKLEILKKCWDNVFNSTIYLNNILYHYPGVGGTSCKKIFETIDKNLFTEWIKSRSEENYKKLYDEISKVPRVSFKVSEIFNTENKDFKYIRDDLEKLFDKNEVDII